jgi:hypothetical protein
MSPSGVASDGHPGPVFIGGLSGTGKTALRRALEHCPSIRFTRKSYLWANHFGRHGDLRRPEQLAKAVDAVVEDGRGRSLRPDRARLLAELAVGRPSYARLIGLVHLHDAQRRGAPRWGEQFGLVELYAPAILEAWPSARFVHLVRDPRACGPSNPARAAAIGWRLARWLRSTRAGLEVAAIRPEAYRFVRFEDLVAAPDRALSEICTFFSIQATTEMTEQVRKELEQVRVQGATRGARIVERYTSRELEQLGYVPESAPSTARSTRPGRRIARVGITAWDFTVGRRLDRQLKEGAM